MNQENSNFKIRNILSSMERTFLPVGSRIGKYRIIEEIDRGGMAVVYKAVQLDLDREVALKVMPANISLNPRFVERFLSEAHAIAKLNHPNIVSIYEVAVENNIYYLSMEYIPGKNLYYYLHYAKPKLVEVLEIISKLAEALGYAHKQKIIHRDLKLNNVIMKNSVSPVLIDFGLAKAMENETKEGITRTGELMGSPSYMAPERLLGGVVDHRSDICSLGIMLYEMLTFKNPYLDQRNLHQTALNVMEANPIPPRKLVPWLPPEIEAITLKAMAREPSSRYATMEEFKADILRYQRGEAIIAQPPSVWSKIRRFSKKHWAPLVISGLVVLFSVLFGTYYYIQLSKEQSRWQLIFNYKFGDNVKDRDWSFFPGSAAGDSQWTIKNGELYANSNSMSYVRLQRKLDRDILVEFDISALDLDLYNAGIYLFGNSPDSGYTFYINKDGAGNHGILFPDSKFPFQNAASSKINLTQENHVTIKRIQNLITFSINGTVAAKVWDLLPPLGKSHDGIGFFVNNGKARFDDLKIYRRAIPLVPSPTLIADRFWERGDFEAALDEYRGLQLDLAGSYNYHEIMIRMADCLVRLDRPQEALELLDEIRDDQLAPRKKFLQGVIFNRMKNDPAADSAFCNLATRFPSSSANLSAMTMALLNVSSHLDQSRPDLVKNELAVFSDRYRKFPLQWGRMYMALAHYYFDKGRLDSCLTVVNEIMASNVGNAEIFIEAKTLMGRVYLQQGKKDRAGEIFDQCMRANLNEKDWDALYGTAEICEYDFLKKDAKAIYEKIYREGPRSTPLAWMAGVKAAELLFRDSSQTSRAILREIISGPHPFPIPRLTAKYLLGELSASQFKYQWSAVYPDDRYYLYFIAWKANLENQSAEAAVYLDELKRSLNVRTWRYFQTIQILNNMSRW